jgi:dTDP-4-amino-4,6-dideoxygalactose transaminase
MYVSAWQGLSPLHLVPRRRGGTLPYPLAHPRTLGFHVARNAIYHIFKSMGLRPGDNVLVPAYHSGNEVKAIRAAGAEPRYFSVDRRMEPDLGEIESLCDDRTRALFAIHFIGWPQPVEAMVGLCRRRGIPFVEDCALAFLSRHAGKPLGTFGAHSIFCLYKTLPVPNGGILACNDPMPRELEGLKTDPCGRAMLLGRVAEMGLERLRGRANLLGAALFGLKRGVGTALSAFRVKRVPVGDMGFVLGNVNLGMAGLSRRLLPRFDYEAIVAARRRNFEHLRSRLEGKATLLEKPLAEGTCPLFFPILVPDKGRASQALKARGVMATEFWNTGEPEATRERFPDTWYLRDHLLEIPIHQDVTPRQVDYVADRIVELGLRF